MLLASCGLCGAQPSNVERSWVTRGTQWSAVRVATRDLRIAIRVRRCPIANSVADPLGAARLDGQPLWFALPRNTAKWTTQLRRALHGFLATGGWQSRENLAKREDAGWRLSWHDI